MSNYLLNFTNVQDELRRFLVSEIEDYFAKLGFDKYPIEFTFTIEENQENDSFQVDLDKASLKIKANTKAGLLIGFYRFLQRLGVRFPRPGKEHDVLPDLSKFDLLSCQIHLESQADFKHRGVCIEGANSLENILDFIDWLPKIDMNSFFVQFEDAYTFMERWYRHINNPKLQVQAFDPEIATLYDGKITEAMAKRGILHQRVGHGWTGKVLGYSSIFGWDQGKDLDPEKAWMVAQVNGKRELISGVPVLTNLCLSDPKVVDALVDTVVTYCQERYDVDLLHVWMADALNTTCECQHCQDKIFADQYVALLNKIDQALTQKNIQTKICFLIYLDLLYPPQFTDFLNPDRFVMMFAPISRTFQQSYAEIDYDKIALNQAPYVKNQLKMPHDLENNLSFLKAWQAVFKGESFIYDYPLGRAHYGDFGYDHIARVIGQDIKTLEVLGLDGYISCQELRAGLPTNLPNYVMGKVLWQKDIDLDQLIEEYYQSLFGDQWHKAQTYLEKVSSLSSIDYFVGKGQRQDLSVSKKYEALLQYLQETPLADLKTVSHPQQMRNWTLLNYHGEIIKKLLPAVIALSKGDDHQASVYWTQCSDYMRQHESSYQSYLDVYRLHEIAQNYTRLSRLDKQLEAGYILV